MKDGETVRDKRSERYRYLQAKHKQNEKSDKITAADLLNDNNGEFSLPKYFRSYYSEIIRINGRILQENVHDCIICTNIGFDSKEKLKNSGIELISLDDEDKILTLDKVPERKKIPSRYKLKKTEKFRRKMSEWSDIHLLAKTLLEFDDLFISFSFLFLLEILIARDQSCCHLRICDAELRSSRDPPRGPPRIERKINWQIGEF